MKRGIIGSRMNVRSIFWFVIAMAMLLPAGMASANDTVNPSAWYFVNLNLDVYAGGDWDTPGDGYANVVQNASAVMYGKDTVNGTVYNYNGSGGHRDGKVKESKQGQFIPTTDKPIIANIESDEPVYMFAVIGGVDSATVTAIKTEDATVLAAVKDVLRASFPAKLLGGNATDKYSLYADLTPTSVTGIDADNKYGITASKNNTLVAWWTSGAGITMAATQYEADFSTNGLQGRVAITGSTVNNASGGTTNLIGCEITKVQTGVTTTGPRFAPINTNDALRATLNAQGFYSGVTVFDGTDTTWLVLSDPEVTSASDAADKYSSLDPSVRVTTEVPFQFRGGDIIEITAVISTNPERDGEPDAYWNNVTDGDPFNLLTSTNAAGTFVKDSDGMTSESGTMWKNQVVLDKQGSGVGTSAQIKSVTSDLTMTFGINQSGLTDPWVDLDNVYAWMQDGPVADTVILHVTSKIINNGDDEFAGLNFTTIGEYTSLNFTMQIADDVGASTSVTYAGNTSSQPLYADTQAPYIGEITLSNEDTSVYHNKVGAAIASGLNWANDEVGVTVKVARNGENISNGSWFKMTVEAASAPSDDIYSWAANEALVSIDELANHSGFRAGGTTSATAFSNDVPKAKAGSETVTGISATVLIQTEVSPETQRDPGAEVIVCVSDDARNPAVAYIVNEQRYMTTNSFALENITAESQIGDATVQVRTSKKYASVSSFDPSFAARAIGKATVAIDAAPPTIQDVTLFVASLPDNFLPSANSAAAFKYIKMTTEVYESTTMNATTVLKMGDDHVISRINAGDDIVLVTRAVSKISSEVTTSGDQNGSDVKVVVQFALSSDTADADITVPNYTDRAGNTVNPGVETYLKNQFNYNLHSWQLGYATTVANPDVVGTTFNIVGTKIDAANNIGYVTFESLSEITLHDMVGGVGAKVARSIRDGSIFAKLDDSVYNFNVDGSDSVSNLIVVDVSRATAYLGIDNNIAGMFAIPQFPEIVNATKRGANAVVIVTDTQNMDLDDLRSGWGENYSYNPEKDPLWYLASTRDVLPGTIELTGGYSYPFINSASSTYTELEMNRHAVTEIKAGYMIIVSASFMEPIPDLQMRDLENVGDVSPYVQIGGYGAFPYTLSATPEGDVTAPGVQILDPNTSYTADSPREALSSPIGEKFLTITADFSDFVVGAEEIIPDVSLAVVQQPGDVFVNTGVMGASPNSVIYATWYYLIDQEAGELNDKAPDAVRLVTFTTRDLSGNITKTQIAVATGEFSEPIPTIATYYISNNKEDQLAVTSTTIANATLIEGSTIYLVAKVGDGSSNGGPFKSGDYLYADFTDVGGTTATLTPTYIMADYSSGSDEAHDTWANNKDDIRTNAASDTIVYATWEIAAADLSAIAGDDTNGARDAKITVTAIGSSLAVNTVDTIAVDVDGTKPTGGTKYSIGEVSSPADGDDLDDSFLRPGSVFCVTGEFAVDNNDTEANTSFSADLSKFVTNGDRVAPTNVYFYDDTDLPGITDIAVPNNKVWVVWKATVSDPSPTSGGKIVMYATDSAEQTGTTENLNGALDKFVFTGGPQITNVVIDASRAINYVTDAVGIQRDWYSSANNAEWIASKIGSNISRNDITSHGLLGANKTVSSTATVTAGDKIRVVVTVELDDPEFVNIDRAVFDFSNFGGGLVTMDPDDEDDAPYIKVSYPIVRVTAEFDVTTSAVTLEDATVPVVIYDPAEESDTDYAPGLDVDYTFPEITSVEVKYFEGGVLTSDGEYDPAPGGSVNAASALLKVVVSYPDSDDDVGYPASVLAAAMQRLMPFKSGNPATMDANYKAQNWLPTYYYRDALNNVNQSTANYDDVLRTIVSANAVEYDPTNLATYQATDSRQDAIVPSWVKFTGAGPTVYSTSPYAVIRACTNTTMTAYFGYNPNTNPDAGDAGITTLNDGIIIDGSINSAATSFVICASDNIGNVTTIETTDVQIDSDEPVINIISLDVDTDTQVEGQDYLGYLAHADGTIYRPTRVTTGTRMKLVYEVSDSPVATDLIESTINSSEFDGENVSVTVSGGSLAGEGTNSLTKNYDFDTAPTSTKSTVTVLFDVGSDVTSTFPLDVNDDPTRAANYYQNAAEQVLVSATDTAGNIEADFASDDSDDAFPIEIDVDGPEIIEEAVFAKDSGTEDTVSITDLATAAKAQLVEAGGNAVLVNAKASQWIVFAATMVVDSSDTEDFVIPSIDWYEKLEPDSSVQGRRLTSNVKSGSEPIVSCATRTVLFVTTAVQVVSNPLTKQPENLEVTDSTVDRFGNKIDGDTQTTLVGITAKGPSALDLITYVNDISEENGTGYLGIGNNTVDCITATFEAAPGDTFKVYALLTTVNGEIPENIFADFSDLYPAELSESVNEVYPSSVVLTDDELVEVVWEYILYDFRGSVPGHGAVHVAFPDPTIIGAWDTETYATYDSVIVDTTPLTTTGIDTTAPADKVVDASLAELIGFPFIALQQNAVAQNAVRIPITVDDDDDQFAAETVETVTFAIDTVRPTADVEVNIVSRDLDESHPNIQVFTSQDNALRAGFPYAPGLVDNIDINALPNRVRGGDTLDVVVTFDNIKIDGSGDDRFKELESGDLFTLDTSDEDSAIAGLLSSITANLSNFNEALTNVSLLDADSISFATQENAETVITATFRVEVASTIGVKSSSSKLLRWVTPTIQDDADNLPRYNAWDKENKDILDNYTGMSVDNYPPANNVLEVRLVSGNAISSDRNPIAIGEKLTSNSVVEESSVLEVYVVYSETFDNPTDIFNNDNYGDISIEADTFTIAEYDTDDISDSDSLNSIQDIEGQPGSIEGKFFLQVPSEENGESISSFVLTVRATDTVGNSSPKASSVYYLDASPIITITRSGQEYSTSAFTVNAGDDFVLDANVFDAGGVDSIKWVIDPNPPVGYEATSDGVDFVNAPTGNSQDEDIQLTVTPLFSADDSAANMMTAYAEAKDISDITTASMLFTVNFNQPSLFDEVFAATVETAYASDTQQATFESEYLGWNTTDEDIRSIALSEGHALEIIVGASDANRDANLQVNAAINTNLNADQYILKADGQVLVDGTIATLANGIGSTKLTFVPKFNALRGDVEEATFAIELTAADAMTDSDGASIAADKTIIWVTVEPYASVPEIEVVSITSDEEAKSTTLNDSVQVTEGQELEIVLLVTDPGDDEINYTVTTDNELTGTETIVADGTSALTLTYSYIPGIEESDLPKVDKEDDPFVLEFDFDTATSETASATKQVDILNESQAPTITTTVSIAGGDYQSAQNGETLAVQAGDEIVFKFAMVDPDGDQVFTNYDVSIGDVSLESPDIETVKTGSVDKVTLTLTIDIPVDAVDDGLVEFDANDLEGKQSSVQFVLKLTAIEDAPDVDEVVFGQGLGGSTYVNVKNFDPNNFDSPVNAVLKAPALVEGGAERGSYSAINSGALTNNGGGLSRSTRIAVGDLNNDGLADIVTTHDIVIADATYPNNIKVMDAGTFTSIAHPWDAFPVGTDLPFKYNYGDQTAAIGDFIGAGTNQLAVAQGYMGNQMIRLFMFTGEAQPNGWAVVGYVPGLVANASTTNASGRITLGAGDIDSDGVDELIVGQDNSVTSQTLFHAIDFQQTAGEKQNGAYTVSGVEKRTPWAGFNSKYRGNGGAKYAVADLNGDGTSEIVAASQGDDTRSVVGANDNVISSFINVVIPDVNDGEVTAFDYAETGTMTVFSIADNPSGALDIAAGEIDGDETNGDELVVSTGAIYKITGGETVTLENNAVKVNSMTIEAAQTAPRAKFRIFKLDFDGDKVSGWSSVDIQNVQYGRFAGVNAFGTNSNPTSGAAFIGTGDTHIVE